MFQPDPMPGTQRLTGWLLPGLRCTQLPTFLLQGMFLCLLAAGCVVGGSLGSEPGLPLISYLLLSDLLNLNITQRDYKLWSATSTSNQGPALALQQEARTWV